MGNSTFKVSPSGGITPHSGSSGTGVLLADIRNAGEPFYEKDVFIYSARLTVADGDFEANGNLTLTLEGVTEVEGFNLVEDRNGTFANIVPSSITYTTTAGDVKVAIVIAINSSATALHIHAICRV